MPVSNANRELITKEINFAVKKMEESEAQSQKLYYFSAIFGIFHRVLNMDYDPELVFSHFILRQTHDAFQSRLQAITVGKDSTVTLSDEQFLKLSALSKKLASRFEKKLEVDSILKKFTILLYSTTGNGFYLMQKGVLKI